MEIANKALLFLIGFTAGICSTMLPRIVAALSTSGQVMPFSGSIVALSFAFSTIVGVVVAIIEWNENKSPRDVFFAALGVPALLAGLFNTADGVRLAVDAQKREKAVVEDIQRATNVPTVTPDQAPAHMIGPTGALDPDLRIRRTFELTEEQYWVVIGPIDSQQGAEHAAETWGGRVAAHDGRIYVDLSGPLPKGEALAEAIRWREKGAPGVALLKVVPEQGA